MRRVPLKAWLLLVGALAVFGVLLILSASDDVTVVSLERNMNNNQDDLKSRDCYISALTKDHKKVSGYAPSSFCSSVKVGDTVTIKDGYVTRK